MEMMVVITVSYLDFLDWSALPLRSAPCGLTFPAFFFLMLLAPVCLSVEFFVFSSSFYSVPLSPSPTYALTHILRADPIRADPGVRTAVEGLATDCPSNNSDSRGWWSIPRVGQHGQLSGTRRQRACFAHGTGEARPIPAIIMSLYDDDEDDDDDCLRTLPGASPGTKEFQVRTFCNGVAYNRRPLCRIPRCKRNPGLAWSRLGWDPKAVCFVLCDVAVQIATKDWLVD